EQRVMSRFEDSVRSGLVEGEDSPFSARPSTSPGRTGPVSIQTGTTRDLVPLFWHEGRSDMTKRGKCLCGVVSFEFSGAENWRAHCHCESCRRNTSSPFTTWFGVPNEAFSFTRKMPKVYASSPGARRMFCGDCGTPIAFEHDKFPHEIHLYAASLENPKDFQPDFHVYWNERLPWLHWSDGLPKYATTRV